MPMTAAQLAWVVARDLARNSRVWLDESLDSAFGLAIARRARLVQDLGSAEVAVVTATELAGDGSISLHRSLVGKRVLAVLQLQHGGRIVRKPSSGPRAMASRAYSLQCVLEPSRDGLVIVELAKGVAATDVQAMAEPTLLISAAVKEMTVDDTDSEG